MVGLANVCLVNFPTSVEQHHTAGSLSFSMEPSGAVSHAVSETFPDGAGMKTVQQPFTNIEFSGESRRHG